jgi:hypothetical protein
MMNKPTAEAYFGAPDTAHEQVARWDEGRTIWSIEMGGLGPGYEQAIQVLAVEITRDNLDKELPGEENYRDWGDDTVHRIDKQCGGFSGAQVGAAKQIAYRLAQGRTEKGVRLDP